MIFTYPVGVAYFNDHISDAQIDGRRLAETKRAIWNESKGDPMIVSKLMYGDGVEDALEEIKIMFKSKLTSTMKQ